MASVNVAPIQFYGKEKDGSIQVLDIRVAVLFYENG